MSPAALIRRKLSKELPGTYVAQSYIVLPPTTFIMRGFVLERTITPGDYYFHEVISPLWRPLQSIILNYSQRLFGGGRITISPQNISEGVSRILSEAVPRVDSLRALQSPGDFISFVQNPGRKLNTAPNKTDLACAHLLNGSISKCLASLKAHELELQKFTSEQRAIYFKSGKELMAALNQSDAQAVALLNSWRAENMKKCKLIA